MKADVKSAYNIYRIIDKVKKCIRERAEEKNIKIQMSSDFECRDMQAYDCIELLPYIFLDNAIKYSPNGETINIVFEEKGKNQHISIKSIGPVVHKKEENRLTDQGFRGENAISLTSDGMGIGLYTAKCICELNDIVLKINSGQDVLRQIKNIDYSEFSVDFWIKLW